MPRDEKKFMREFNSWFKDIGIVRKNGTVNLAQVKRELRDFYFMLQQVPKVYCEVTGNKLSKPNYYADSVIQVYEEDLNDRCAEATAIFADDIMDLAKNCKTLGEFKAEVVKMAKEYIVQRRGDQE